MPFRYSKSMLRLLGLVLMPPPVRGFLLDALFGVEDVDYDATPITRRPRPEQPVGVSSTPSSAASHNAESHA